MADHSGLVRNKCIRLPSTIPEATSERPHLLSAEHIRQAPHEGGLATTRICRHTNHDNRLILAKRSGAYGIGATVGRGLDVRLRPLHALTEALSHLWTLNWTMRKRCSHIGGR